jgi:TolB-like protein/pimeloyl-ACP methyl ester carboxylesterase/Tfp pilus assembly protein PilF/predicted Ser/Thr protein kinase
MEPQIRYCTSADGTRIAYATAGHGSPLVLLQGWSGSLEFYWKHPQSYTFVESLSKNRLYIQFDRRGVASSQHDVEDLSMEAHLADIAAVVDDLGIERFDLLACTDGAPVGAAYAARHPERISRLVLWAPFAHGEETTTPDEMRGIVEFIRKNWSLATRAMADVAFPSGPIEFQRDFTNRLRQTVPPENAERYLEFINSIDISAHLSQVKAPTLVLHRRGSRTVPIASGRAVAALIPKSRFVALEGDMAPVFLGDLSHMETVRQFLEGLEVVAPGPEPLADTGIVGKTISHYKILEKLGEGGMGVVYRAEDTKLERSVALKFLSSNMLGGEEEKIRFAREAKAAAALAHPSICHTYEIGEAEDQTFIAMEYVDGKSLAEKIESGPLKVDEALDIAIQVADGLQEAHEKGIIHRDIKAANIIVSKRGRAKVLDFGLAKLAGKTRLTKTATIVGTVAYMSPEQAHGEAAIDHHTDIWSLGVLIYEMLAGRQPFDAPSDAGLIHKIIYEEPEPLSKVRTDIPIALEQAIKKTLQKNPQDRYENMDTLISDLKSIRAGATPTIVVEEKATPSIAVLPFADMSPQKDQEYFCDGISESIINELTQLSDLRVIARTSAFSFKGQNLDVREIGRRLDVGTVLEGSIQKAGDRVRVTAQLVNTTRGEHLWSEKYDRDMEDIFAIQDEISGAIVERLKPKLLGEPTPELRKRQTVDLDAYNLYLRGRWFYNKQTGDGLTKAIEYFEQTLSKAPDYAQAYAAIADCYVMLPFLGSFAPREAFPKAKETAIKAVEIDDTSAEARVSLGLILQMYEYDWDGAEKEYKKAIELNPGYAMAYDRYALLLLRMCRYDEGIVEIKRALELDPLSLQIHRDATYVFCLARKPDQAIEIARRAIELDPYYSGAHAMLGFAYLQNSMYEEAKTELRKEMEVSGGLDPIAETLLGMIDASTGNIDEAKQVLENLIERSRREYIPPYFIARLSFVVEGTDQGFDWLEKAYEEHDNFLCHLKVDPFFERLGICSDPRYIEMLRRIGLAKSDATVPIIEPSPSIAVLPFVNMSADPEQEYFCDGLSEELINALTQIKDLKVIARTSAFSFRGKDIDVRDIGNKLHVGTVLEGSVRKAGNRLRITAQLVDTSGGHHLWSEKYDREMEDIFDIQDEITEAIVDKLTPKLLGEKKKQLAGRQTMDTESYNLYLKGSYHASMWTPEGFQKAEEYYRQAIEKDANCALAYTGLAALYNAIPFATFVPPEEILSKAKEAALKAMEIDETLAEAHSELATVKVYHDYDWQGAGSEYRRALELNPGNGSIRMGYAIYLLYRARFEEALIEIEEVIKGDPFDPRKHVCAGIVYFYNKLYSESIEACKVTVEMSPNFSMGHVWLGRAYVHKSMYEEAMAAFEKEKAITQGMNPWVEAFSAFAYARMGRNDEIRRLLDDLLERTKQGYVSPTSIATLYFLLRENDKGFDWLEKAYEARDYWLIFVTIGRVATSIRSDPRYKALLKKMNLDK